MSKFVTELDVGGLTVVVVAVLSDPEHRPNLVGCTAWVVVCA